MKNMISFVIPCYNEAHRLPKTLKSLETFFKKFPDEYELIFVNDGSKDNTENILQKTKYTVISYKQNQGKGHAVKKGMKKAKGEYIFMMDCDLATDLQEINNFLKKKEKQDILCGKRTVRKGIRQLGAVVVATIIKILFRLPISDTQCGFKLFNKKSAKIFEKLNTKGWAFDVEILYRAHKENYKIEEQKIKWAEQEISTVKWYHVFYLFRELIKIKQKV